MRYQPLRDVAVENIPRGRVVVFKNLRHVASTCRWQRQILGSADCNELALQMDAFGDALREEMEEEKLCYIPLPVAYGY